MQELILHFRTTPGSPAPGRSTTWPRSGGRLSRDLTRASSTSASALRIVVAAERLFALHGIDGVSLRQIAVEAGSSNNSAVHYHFTSKEGLIRAIFQHRLPQIISERRMLGTHCDPDDLRRDSRPSIYRYSVSPKRPTTTTYRSSNSCNAGRDHFREASVRTARLARRMATAHTTTSATISSGYFPISTNRSVESGSPTPSSCVCMQPPIANEWSRAARQPPRSSSS